MNTDHHDNLSAFPLSVAFPKECTRVLADVLASNRERILSSFEAEITKYFAEKNNFRRSALLGSLPKLLEELEGELRGRQACNPSGEASSPCLDASHTPRSRYSLADITREFTSLRKVLFRVIEENLQINFSLSEFVLDFLARKLTLCCEEIAELERRDLFESSREVLRVRQENLSLINRLGAIAWIYDLELLRFLEVSHKAGELLGYEILNCTDSANFFKKHIYRDDLRKLLSAIAEAKKTGKETVLEHRFFSKDGKDRWFETTIQFENTGPHHQLLRGICFDVTERKIAEQESRTKLDRSLNNLTVLNDEKNLRENFVNTLAHDLRNPLAVANLTAQMMAGEKDANVLNKRANQIVSCLKRMDRMVQDLLDTNRIKAAQPLSLRIGRVDLTALVSEVVAEMRLVHGDRFHLEVAPGINGIWSADGIRRILENLIGNAVKYGTPASLVSVKGFSPPGLAVLSIHNEGNPIPAGALEQIFEPFCRTSSAETSDEPGWGIGLTLVKGLTEAHGGRVSVVSGLELGTTFTIEIPLERFT